MTLRWTAMSDGDGRRVLGDRWLSTHRSLVYRILVAHQTYINSKRLEICAAV
jgi:hypothetical protein